MDIERLKETFDKLAKERFEIVNGDSLDGELGVYASMLGLIKKHESQGKNEVKIILSQQLNGMEQHYRGFKLKGMDDDDTDNALKGIEKSKLKVDSLS